MKKTLSNAWNRMETVSYFDFFRVSPLFLILVKMVQSKSLSCECNEIFFIFDK